MHRQPTASFLLTSAYIHFLLHAAHEAALPTAEAIFAKTSPLV